MSLILAVLLVGQGIEPLRKSDLVRLLSGPGLSQGELAQLVSRNCLTFDPTDRDRTDFLRLGADRALLVAVDGCARRAAARRAPASRPTPPPPPPPSPPTPSAERSGFVAGGGQRGPAGARLPRALVFELRDSAGAPLVGRTVAFTGINARIDPATALTDEGGQVRAGVTLGDRAGSALVIAAVGTMEKEAAYKVTAGPAAQLLVKCGEVTLAGRFAMRPDTALVLQVFAQDGFANPTPLLGLRAAVADARIFRVLGVTQDSLAGTVALKPDQPGTTSLAVIANGMREYLTVTVPPRAAPGRVDCR